ncbi:MAG TPA: copper resistance protein B [Caulobacterales bacterium]|nr:copper resistance protein B [Caulobacterales bacterium]
MDGAPTYHMARGEFDYGSIDGDNLFTWDGEAWIGGDHNRLWLKSEGAVRNGETEDAEIQALWSRPIASYWDFQAGLRADIEPDSHGYLALGIEGLAPYTFETEATAFLRDDGDLSARLRQSIDFRLTQRLVLQPHVEANIYAQDDAARNIGAGFADIDAGLQFRYEITREVAPYLDFNFTRALGETASLQRRAGEDPEQAMLRAGVRLWF